MAEYRIIEIIEYNDKDTSDMIGIDGDHWLNNPINKLKIKELYNFKGPNFIDFNNFGLYAGEDLSMFAFYYRDDYKNL